MDHTLRETAPPRARGRLTPLEWVSALGYVIGGFLAVALILQEQFFRVDGRPLLVTMAFGLPLIGILVIARGGESMTQAYAQGLYSMGLIAVGGYFAVSPIMSIAAAASLGMVTLSIAVRCTARQTFILVGLSPIASGLTISTAGIGGWPFITVSGLVAAIAICPGVSIVYYRRQLDIALDKLRLLAATDSLTGLTNRHGMLELVPMLCAEAERRGRIIGVMMADVDHFKQFNDEFGHQAGDEALRAVAGVIRNTVRQTDIVARYGGEEMCVVAAFDAIEDFGLLAERIRKNVESSTECGVTLSIGGYTCRPSRNIPHNDLFTSMVGKADEQLYAAKHAGRNAVHVSAA